MFDDVIRELRRLGKGERVPLRLPLDEEGYLDRVCPSRECRASFKVLFEDWSTRVRDEAVYCPICRHEAKSTEWDTPEQNKHIEKVVQRHVIERLDRAFKTSAPRFNSTHARDGFIRLSMSYRPGPKPILLPVYAAAIMEEKWTCALCGCQYSSVGAAFFCPACGHNSAASTFDRAVSTVRHTIESLPRIREAIESAAGRDVAEDSVRQTSEGSLVKLVASFQRFSEAVFDILPNAAQFKRRRNMFQSLSESTLLWQQATGKGYEDILSNTELRELGIFFQQRHLLAHREGIVDQDYVDKSRDTCYSVGQRLVITASAVSRLAELVSKLGEGISRRDRD